MPGCKVAVPYCPLLVVRWKRDPSSAGGSSVSVLPSHRGQELWARQWQGSLDDYLEFSLPVHLFLHPFFKYRKIQKVRICLFFSFSPTLLASHFCSALFTSTWNLRISFPVLWCADVPRLTSRKHSELVIGASIPAVLKPCCKWKLQHCSFFPSNMQVVCYFPWTDHCFLWTTTVLHYCITPKLHPGQPWFQIFCPIVRSEVCESVQMSWSLPYFPS